jgi:hypothetical protein
LNPFALDFAAIPRVPFAAMTRDQPAEANKAAPRGGQAFLARAHRRRFACLKAAREILEHLPEQGEALHGIMTGIYDLMHLLIVLLQRLGAPCHTMRIATLSLSGRNVQEMVALLDAGTVGRIDLLTSDFHRKNDQEIFCELLAEFSKRGQRIGAARSHCKLVAIALDDGRKYVLHGSPNLRTNKNMEQFCLERDAELFAFYDTWLDGMVTTHEVRQKDCAPTG